MPFGIQCQKMKANLINISLTRQVLELQTDLMSKWNNVNSCLLCYLLQVMWIGLHKLSWSNKLYFSYPNVQCRLHVPKQWLRDARQLLLCCNHINDRLPRERLCSLAVIRGVSCKLCVTGMNIPYSMNFLSYSTTKLTCASYGPWKYKIIFSAWHCFYETPSHFTVFDYKITNYKRIVSE